MPVENQANKVLLNGTGSQTEFQFSFKIFKKENIDVFVVSEAGVQTKKTLDIDYSVSSEDLNLGGIVTLIDAPLATEKVLIIRNIPLEQNADFRPVSGFPEEVITDSFDTSRMIDQDLQEQIDRCIKTSSSADMNSFVLPKGDAGKAIIWGPDGKSFVNATRTEEGIVEDVTEQANIAREQAVISAEQAAISTEQANRAEGQADIATERAQFASDVVVGFDTHAAKKQNDFDINAANVTARFDNNYLDKTNNFNANAQSMTEGFNTNVSLKIDDFDAHAMTKEIEFDDHAASKEIAFDEHAAVKEVEFDEHAAVKLAEASASAIAAEESATRAKDSEEKAKVSEDNARTSEINAGISEANAKSSEDIVATNASRAEEAERLAGVSSKEAKDAADLAVQSKNAAATSETNASGSAERASGSEVNAEASAIRAAEIVATMGDDAQRAETAAANAEKYANGTIEEYPEGSSKYWRDQAQAIVGSGQMLLEVDQEVPSSKTFQKDQFVQTLDLDSATARNQLGKAIIFTDKNKKQIGGIGVYYNNNGTPMIRTAVQNDNGIAFSGVGITPDGKTKFLELPDNPPADSDNKDAASTAWVNTKLQSKQNNLNTTQLNAANSGITSSLVSKYSSYEAIINGKQEALTGGQMDAANSGITSSLVSKYNGYEATINGKQGALNAGQLNAVNSGITSELVSKYNGYDAVIKGKQTALNAEQLNAVNSKITNAKVTKYDGYEAKINSKQPAGSYQTTGNLSQTLDASTVKYPSNKAVSTAISNIDLSSRANTNLSNLTQEGKDVIKNNSRAGMPVGTIFAHSASATYVPENSLPTDGHEYAQAQFKTLYNDWLVGKRLETCTYEQYQQEITATGECLKFALDTTRKTFKVPTKLNKYVSPNDDKKMPVVTGTPHEFINDINNNGITMARNSGQPFDSYGILALDNKGSLGLNTPGGTAERDHKMKFDNLYTNLKLGTKEIRYFVVVATGSIKQSEMDWSQWASSLEGKLNKDMTNLPVTNDIVVEHKVNSDGSWYRKYKSGWLEQGGIIEGGPDTFNYIVSFPKPFASNNYQVGYTSLGTNTSQTGSQWRFLSIYPLSPTQFKGVKINFTRHWYACGQGV